MNNYPLKKLAVYASVFTCVFMPFNSSSLQAQQANAGANFVEVAKTSIPAVVSIRVKVPTQSGATYFFNGREYQPEEPFDFFGDDFFNQFFGRSRKERAPQQQLQTGQASGFIISDDGYIITNAHVVKDAKEINVVLDDEREFSAEVVGVDPNTDIAVIKIQADKLPYLPLGNSDNLEVGQWVMAIGNPLGLQASVTTGVVSAKGRNNLDIARIEDFIQTDAAINRGNSGGPLLSLDGNVIGMNTAIVTNMGSGGYMGIGFAIPSNIIKHVSQELIKTGNVTRGFMGVVLQQVDSDLAQAFGLNRAEGALISEITKESPAEIAGLRQGDIVLEYNRKRVNNIGALRNAVMLMQPGSRMDLTILRNGQKMNVTMTVGTYPADGKKTPFKDNRIGVEVESLSPDIAKNYGYGNMRGVVISKVESGSAAAMAGLKKGTLIVAVNHKEIDSITDFDKLLNDSDPKKPILLLVKQGDYMQFVSIKIK